MKIKTNLKLILIIVFFTGVVGGGSYFLLLPQPNLDKPTNILSDNSFGWKFPVDNILLTGSIHNQIAYSNIRDSGGIPQGLPVHLKIPIIGVDSEIEDALITPDGKMDVPAGSVNVAWFSLGPHPGQVGSAVIGGHFGIRNGVKFVFYDLDKLKVGDKIYIADDKSNTLTFVVRLIKLFDRNADATTVFTSQDGLAHLNLITCEGIWNQANNSYPQRLVVFTDAISPEDAAPAIIAFHRSLDIGTRGADVAALQTALEQKGFLTISPGVAYGFFGSLTHAAVAKYQVSASLPPVGVFGPQTRAKFLVEFGGDTGLPNMGTSSITSKPESLISDLIPFPKNAIAFPKAVEATVGLPVRLKIPKLNVDSAIEYVGFTADGAMDAPKNPADAAWFNLGPRPGENGSAVISGHYGWKNGVPAVFDNLHKLRKGDRLYIEDEKGVVIAFVVRESRTYDPKADASNVFDSSDGKIHLNFVTCEGVWNKVFKSYSKRLVVFTDKE